MALANPNLLCDVGFQLSFMATLGLVLYATPLSDAFTRLASRLLSSSTAQHLAGPVGEYVLLILGGQALLVSLVFQPLGQLLAYLALRRFHHPRGGVFRQHPRRHAGMEQLSHPVAHRPGRRPVPVSAGGSRPPSGQCPAAGRQRRGRSQSTRMAAGLGSPACPAQRGSAGDRHARPASEVLQSVQGYTLLRSDQNGWVELTIDRWKLWVEVEKK
jgi:Competence protein